MPSANRTANAGGCLSKCRTCSIILGALVDRKPQRSKGLDSRELFRIEHKSAGKHSRYSRHAF